jgi:hypothetical protein
MFVKVDEKAEKAWAGVAIEMENLINKQPDFSRVDMALLHDAYVKGFETGYEEGHHDMRLKVY